MSYDSVPFSSKGGDVEGYPASFLEEAFGGVVREHGARAAKAIEFVGDDAERHFQEKNGEMLARIRAKREGSRR